MKNDKPLNYRALAERYDRSVRTIRRWVAAGRFPRPVRMGAGLYFRADDLAAFEAREVAAAVA